MTTPPGTVGSSKRRAHTPAFPYQVGLGCGYAPREREDADVI